MSRATPDTISNLSQAHARNANRIGQLANQMNDERLPANDGELYGPERNDGNDVDQNEPRASAIWKEPALRGWFD